MSSFMLSCESTADRTAAFFAEHDIAYICFHYEVDGKVYLDDLYRSTTSEQFFASIAAGAQPKTSQVGTGEYIDFWEPSLKEGKDVLHVSLSSGISGTYNSACLAAQQLRERYPERRIRVIDSLAASAGYGLLMEYLADLRDAGSTFDEVADWAEAHKLNVHHWFFSSDLTSFIRGGRISKASGVLGAALKICPLMNVDNTGHLIPREKIRTKNVPSPRWSRPAWSTSMAARPTLARCACRSRRAVRTPRRWPTLWSSKCLSLPARSISMISAL